MISLASIQTQQVAAMPQSVQRTEAPVVITQQAQDQAIAKHEVQAEQVQPIEPVQQATAVSYTYDKDLHGTILRILDSENRVIRQIPPKEVVRLYKAMAQMARDQERSTQEQTV